MNPDVSIAHVAGAGRFAARQGEAEVGFLAYGQSADRLIISHTEVAPALDGHGIGGRLVQAALDYAREAGLKVVPRCPFAAAYIRSRGRKYVDLLDPAYLDSIAPERQAG
jgi:predicted GNAT family acetyltransferase